MPIRSALAVSLLAVAAGCSTLGERGKQLVPTNYRFRTGPFLLSSDFELKADSPVVVCLKSLEDEVARALDFEVADADPTIEVYILNDRESFTHFLKFYYPELPSRRAFFMAQGESRVVYTFASPKLEKDLRHEATHALLNLRFGDLPLWLDEGLAEYFEVPSPADAGSQEHLDKLPVDLAATWKPDLIRLEKLTNIHQMTPDDYREAWAWVYSFLNQPGQRKSILLGYLRDCSEARGQAKLSARLAADGTAPSGEALAAYIASLRNRRVPRTADPKARVVRFQDRAQDAAPSIEPQPRGVKGFFRRVGSLFGL
jgi:hypothetical protein